MQISKNKMKKHGVFFEEYARLANATKELLKLKRDLERRKPWARED